MAGVEGGDGGDEVSLTKEVTIHVKTGYNGLHPVKSLLALHDKTEIFDMDMNWVDAFQLKFGVTVDAGRFWISRGNRWGTPRPVRHRLVENISVLIGEFKATSPKVYKVFVMNNDRNTQQVKVIAPTPMLAPKPMLTVWNAPALGISSRVFGNRKVNVKAKCVGCSRSKGESTTVNSIPNRNAIIGQKFENTGTRKRKWARTARIKTSKKATAMATTTARASSPWEDALKEYNESCGVFDVDNSLPVGVDDGNDNVDDVRNKTCQDSQRGDLHDLGIAYQDVRTGFITGADKRYTNAQFLMCRHELRMLKTEKMNLWAKWATTAPITTNIMRDLLDV